MTASTTQHSSLSTLSALHLAAMGGGGGLPRGLRFEGDQEGGGTAVMDPPEAGAGEGAATGKEGGDTRQQAGADIESQLKGVKDISSDDEGIDRATKAIEEMLGVDQIGGLPERETDDDDDDVEPEPEEPPKKTAAQIKADRDAEIARKRQATIEAKKQGKEPGEEPTPVERWTEKLKDVKTEELVPQAGAEAGQPQQPQAQPQPQAPQQPQQPQQPAGQQGPGQQQAAAIPLPFDDETLKAFDDDYESFGKVARGVNEWAKGITERFQQALSTLELHNGYLREQAADQYAELLQGTAKAVAAFNKDGYEDIYGADERNLTQEQDKARADLVTEAAAVRRHIRGRGEFVSWDDALQIAHHRLHAKAIADRATAKARKDITGALEKRRGAIDLSAGGSGRGRSGADIDSRDPDAAAARRIEQWARKTGVRL